MKPFLALGAIALLGVTGVAGALLIASSGGEEEVVRQIESATPTRGAAKDPNTTATPTPGVATPTPVQCDPNPPPPPGHRLWRWGDITVHVPETGIVVTGISEREQPGRPVLWIRPEEFGGHGIELDARTGAVKSLEQDDSRSDKEAQIQAVAKTVNVCPFDPANAPWPYTGESPASTSKILGNTRYVEPDPASGIQVQLETFCGLGCRYLLVITSMRSTVEIDAELAAPGYAKIADDEKQAFERYLASVEPVESR